MREGLRRGITLPRVTLAGIETTIRPLAGGEPELHPLYGPFAKPAGDDPGGEARGSSPRAAAGSSRRR